MKLSEAKTYVRQGTIEDAEVRIERLVTDEEFAASRRGDYLKRVVDRLVALEVPFQSDENTLSIIASRYLKGTCPYCQKEMECSDDGGASAGGFSWYVLKFACAKCKSSIRITLPPSGIAFTPAQ